MRRLPNTSYELATAVLAQVPWFRERLLTWFGKNKRAFPWRTPGRSPYEIIIAEILLQRTSAANIAKVYTSFLERFPSWEALLQASTGDLQEALRPVGLWRQKAPVLRALARSIVDRQGVIPATRIELEHLEGVGQYIASAILAILHGEPEPFVDVNMARVLERFFGPRKLADIRDDPYLQTLSRIIIRGEMSLEMNWAILDFSALVCKASRPMCEQCPLQDHCKFFQSTRQ